MRINTFPNGHRPFDRRWYIFKPRCVNRRRPAHRLAFGTLPDQRPSQFAESNGSGFTKDWFKGGTLDS